MPSADFLLAFASAGEYRCIILSGNDPMSEDNAFVGFFQRIRGGDDRGACVLVQRYELILQRYVRLRLGDPTLARQVDAEDICQSVLASFFVRAASGQFEIAGPEQLMALLRQMARNKLAFQSRKHKQQKRDRGRVADAPVEEIDPLAGGATPSRIVAGKELLDELRQRLSAEERQIAELRSQGEGWAEIAAKLGGTPDGRRMQLVRALDRVTNLLGLQDS
jgi:RNA polymerase sigma-70 factor (ECF subfamily)